MDLKYLSAKIENPYPVSNVNLMEAPQGFKMERHTHEFFHVNRILKGTVCVETDSETYMCTAGCIFALPPQCYHSLYSQEGYMQIGVDVDRGSDLHGIVEELESMCSGFVCKKLHLSEFDSTKIAGQMEKILSEPTKGNTMRAINMAECQVLDFLDAVRNENSDDFLERFTEMIIKYTPWQLKLSDMSKILCMSRTQIERKAKYAFGCGASEYCARIRYSKVCELLKSDMPLWQIAEECGFCDQCHLSKFFLRRSGMSPREYRKNIK